MEEIAEKVAKRTHLVAGKYIHIDDYELKRRLEWNRGTFNGPPHWHTGAECKVRIDVSSASKILFNLNPSLSFSFSQEKISQKFHKIKFFSELF